MARWAWASASPMPRTVPMKPMAGMAQAMYRSSDSSESSRSTSPSQTPCAEAEASAMLRVAPKRWRAARSERGTSPSRSGLGQGLDLPRELADVLGQDLHALGQRHEVVLEQRPLARGAAATSGR